MEIEPPAIEFGEDQLVFTYLPKDVVVGDREVSIDYGHFDSNNKDLMLYIPPRMIGRVSEEILRNGFKRENNGYFTRKLNKKLSSFIKINEDGTIEGYITYDDSLVLPAIFETFYLYSTIYNKLHILYKREMIKEIKSLVMCGFTEVFPMFVTVSCKEPDSLDAMYAILLSNLSASPS